MTRKDGLLALLVVVVWGLNFVLNALKCENVRILLTDSVSSVQIEDAASQSAAYVVMPMRL